MQKKIIKPTQDKCSEEKRRRRRRETETMKEGKGNDSKID